MAFRAIKITLLQMPLPHYYSEDGYLIPLLSFLVIVLHKIYREDRVLGHDQTSAFGMNLRFQFSSHIVAMGCYVALYKFFCGNVLISADHDTWSSMPD